MGAAHPADPSAGNPPDPAEVATLEAARRRVLERIAAAAERAGRRPGEIQLVAVSKTVGPDRLRAAVTAGLTVLGENRVQEALAKIPLVADAAWHLVGPLQSNKARRAVEAFEVIQTVDSVALAGRLSTLAGELRPGRALRILLQVNIDGDPGKAGFEPAAVGASLDRVLALPHLDVVGLMTVGRLVPNAQAARPTFVALHRLLEALRLVHPGLGPELSMGMSDDFEVAIDEGATIVRLGRVLFGERPHDADHAGHPPHAH